jgi:hypothetical protein
LARTIPLCSGPVAPWLDRLICITTVGTAVGVVWFLARVSPDVRGHGTHEQLGLPPCGWARQGYPCPTCGATTAACLVVHGRLFSALHAHPFGAVVAVSGLLAALFALLCLLRRRSFLDVVSRVPYGLLFLLGTALLLGSWLYKYLTFVP